MKWVLSLVVLVCLAWTTSSQCFGETDKAPGTISSDIKSLSNGSTAFALELLEKVLPVRNGPTDNLFISPISVWSALILTYLGSNGQTKVQMENGLGISSNNQMAVNSQYRGLKDSLLHNATENANYTFHMANKIYFDLKFQLRDCIKENLNGETEKINFNKAPEPSRVTINEWVEDQTEDRIKELLPNGSVDKDTVMVIVNAAYFKGYWEHQFQERATSPQDFFVDSETKIMVDMMRLDKTFLPLLKKSPLGFSAIELPYSGDETSMVIILPDKGTTVEDVIPKLTPDSLNNLYGTLQNTDVIVSLPKFKVEQKFELKDNISAMGMVDLFDDKKADLSGFTGEKGPFASNVIHQTFLEVNEGGTEAAAVTAVIIAVPTSLFIPVIPTETFTVDRPFIMLLRNKPTNTVLFIGVIRNPKQ